MFHPEILILAFAAIVAALPIHSSGSACEVATTFTITGFATFKPAADNPHPPVVSFEFYSGINSTNSTQCIYAGEIDAQVMTPCNDTNAVFKWNGSVLTVGEEHIPCSNDPSGEIQAFGDITPDPFCYSNPPQVPYGAGNHCETRTAEISGSFTRATFNAR